MKVLLNEIKYVFRVSGIDMVQRSCLWLGIVIAMIWGFQHNIPVMVFIAAFLVMDRVLEGMRKHTDLLKIEELEERILKLEEK